MLGGGEVGLDLFVESVELSVVVFCFYQILFAITLKLQHLLILHTHPHQLLLYELEQVLLILSPPSIITLLLITFIIINVIHAVILRVGEVVVVVG